MAPLSAILKAVRRAVQRDLGTFRSIRVNNFFLFVALIVYGSLNSGVRPVSAAPFFLLLGFLLLFPLSSDPLKRIPVDRLALWPLSKTQHWQLRMASLMLSPVIWIAVILLAVKVRISAAVSFVGVAMVMQFAVVLSNRMEKGNPHWNFLRLVPQFPGPLGGLIRNNVRHLLSLLDFYIAFLLSLGGAVYRVLSVHPDPAAFPVLAILVALALSTYTQSLFGLEFGSGITRYHLLPLRGWQILMAKNLAFLGVLLLLVLPLDPLCGLSFGLISLAVGHHSSVLMRLPQQRWRFTGGRLLPVGLVQIIASMGAGMEEQQHGIVVLALSAATCFLSLVCYGKLWDRNSFTLEP